MLHSALFLSSDTLEKIERNSGGCTPDRLTQVGSEVIDGNITARDDGLSVLDFEVLWIREPVDRYTKNLRHLAPIQVKLIWPGNTPNDGSDLELCYREKGVERTENFHIIRQDPDLFECLSECSTLRIVIPILDQTPGKGHLPPVFFELIRAARVKYVPILILILIDWNEDSGWARIPFSAYLWGMILKVFA